LYRIEVRKSKFISFIINAKLNSWVGDGNKHYGPDYSRNYSYHENELKYYDQYFGNLMDGGREIIFYNDNPIWILCYHGGVHWEYNDESKCIFNFLRIALANPPPEFPLRGPRYYEEKRYEYFNNYHGDFYYFSGNETIHLNNTEVYRREYVGGEIRDRRYCFKLV